jgi:CRP/FNR family cyclic AMP-dependent transcriptional regulator
MNFSRFEPGDVIFQEGERTMEAYRILRGKVEITISSATKPTILAQLGPGDIFGEMAMVDERPRSATARCVETTECEVMSPSDFQVAILQQPHRLLPYLTAFFERLRTVNDRLHMELRLRAEGRASAPATPETSAFPFPIPRPARHDHHPERTRLQPPVESVPHTPRAGVHTAILTPFNALCASKLVTGFDPIEIKKFPFRIGRGIAGRDGHETVFSTNDFFIADKEPFQVSRNHCSIEREGDHFFVRDRGSTLGTFVNETPVGVHNASLTHDLVDGENTIILGSSRSPYKFKIELV